MPLDGSQLDETTKILIEGRRRIETSWMRCPIGARMVIDGHCAVLAISRQNVGVRTVPALEVLARAAGFDDLGSIAAWNDAPERTKEDVLAVYDAAISASLSGSAYP